MKSEEILKNFILSKYKSLRAFTQEVDIPYSTVDTMFKRGIGGTSVDTVIKICDKLGISTDALAEGRITPKSDFISGLDTNQSLEIVKKYYGTDDHGKELIDFILNKEYERTIAQRGESKVVSINMETDEEPVVKYALPKYDIPASAGTGEYLDYSECKTVELDYPPPEGASFIIQVKGDSMEPTYYDGDLVFIRSQPTINRGEVGVFYHDGQSYIKTLGRDILVSRNPKYRPIHMDETTRCFGKVVGVYITDPAVHNTKMYRVARDYRLKHGGGEITDVTLKRNILKQNEIVRKEGQIIDFEDN